MSEISRKKFKSDDEKQLNLGVSVLVAAYKSRCKYRSDAIKRVLKKLDVREASTLPRPKALCNHLAILTRAMDEKKRPEDGTRGWEIVIQRAYDELTESQMSVNDIKTAKQEDTSPAEMKVQDIDTQEDLMEKDARETRINEMARLIMFAMQNSEEIENIIRYCNNRNNAIEAISIRFELDCENAAAIVRAFAYVKTDELKKEIKKWEGIA